MARGSEALHRGQDRPAHAAAVLPVKSVAKALHVDVHGVDHREELRQGIRLDVTVGDQDVTVAVAVNQPGGVGDELVPHRRLVVGIGYPENLLRGAFPA